MQTTVQSIWDITSRADSISTLITGILVVLFVAGKLGLDWWNKKQAQKKQQQEQIAPTYHSDEELDSIELITGTYIEIIKKLRTEVDKLKEDVAILETLRKDNEKLEQEVQHLRDQNKILIEAKTRLETKIKNLSVKVKKLEATKKQKTKNRSK